MTWGLGEVKGQDFERLVTKLGPERDFPFYSFGHANRIVDLAEIEPGKLFGF